MTCLLMGDPKPNCCPSIQYQPCAAKYLVDLGKSDTAHRVDGEINDLKSLDEALELGVVKERGKGLVAL